MFLVQEGKNKNKMVNNLKHNVPKEGVIKTNLSQCDLRATVAALKTQRIKVKERKTSKKNPSGLKIQDVLMCCEPSTAEK